MFYLLRQKFPAAEASESCRMLADAATIPGLLFACAGALCWASSQGALDGITYALGHFFRGLIPGGLTQGEGTYADYLEKRREKKTRWKAYGFLLVTGFVFLAVAALFIVLYYVV